MKQMIDDIPSQTNSLPANSGDLVIDLPYNLTLRDYQKSVWDYFMQTTTGLRGLTVWPRRNGKDVTALNILIAKAIQRVGLYLYIGPLQTQVRQVVWLGANNEGERFLDYIPRELVVAKRNSSMEVDLVNGSMIKLVGSDNYNTLMGMNCIGAVFTEYSLQKREAWQYIRPMLAENGGWSLFNGTSRGANNHMYTMFRMAQKNPKWFVQYLTRDDTGIPTLDAIEDDRRSGMPESLVQQEYYNDWFSSSETTFIPLDLVQKTVEPEAELEPKLYNFAPRIFGVDVAYAAKGDSATICFRQGRKVHWVKAYQGMNNMDFANEIAKYIKLIKPAAVFIDYGRGEGVISRLEKMGYDHLVRGIHFGGKVYDESVSNMKAKMWVDMEMFFADPNIPDMTSLDEDSKEQMVNEICTPFKIVDEKNKIKVEPKTALKSRGVSSPDYADSLALTFAEDVEADDVPSPRLVELGIDQDLLDQLARTNAEDNYDPLNYMDSLGSYE